MFLGGRFGPTALTLLAALEGETDEALLRSMGSFLMRMQAEDGKFDPLRMPIPATRRSRWAPGQAVMALARLHRRFGDPAYLEAARKGADYIVDRREDEEGFILDHWFVQAVEEMDPRIRDPRYDRQVWRIAEKLASFVAVPGEAPYPDWVGGFTSWGQEPKGAASLGSCEAILSAYRLSLRRGEGRPTLREAGALCAAFALRLQFREETSFYLPAPNRALGGFRQGLSSPRIRIDGVQHASLALLRFREILREEAAEKP